MKIQQFFTKGLITSLFILAIIGIVVADPMVNQTPETQAFSTTTSINAVGIATENDIAAWQLTNGVSLATGMLKAPANFYNVGPYVLYIPGGSPVFDAMYGQSNSSAGQVQYTVAYDETTTAVNGDISYNKNFALNTGNKVATQDNIQAAKTVTFEGTDAGTMVSSENMLVDGAGQYDWTYGKMLCPFAVSTSTFIPPFCNIVQTGSSVDLTSGRLVTNTHERTVAATSDPGVEVGHDVTVSGIGNGPALGSADAYIKAHIQEGRVTQTYLFIGATEYSIGKTEDLQYSETTSASPVIAKFAKSMNYKSGMNPL